MKTFKFSAIFLALTTTYAASAGGGYDAFTGFSLGVNTSVSSNRVTYGYKYQDTKFHSSNTDRTTPEIAIQEEHNPTFFNAGLVGRYGFELYNNLIGFAELTLSAGNSNQFAQDKRSTANPPNSPSNSTDTLTIHTETYTKISQSVNIGLFVGTGYRITDSVMPYAKVGFNSQQLKIQSTSKTYYSFGSINNRELSKYGYPHALSVSMFTPAVGMGSRFLINDKIEVGLEYQASWGSSKGVKVNSHTVSANLSARF